MLEDVECSAQVDVDVVAATSDFVVVTMSWDYWYCWIPS
jgi:hypothetical protein